VFSPFVGFKGGKGVATAGGMFLALAPIAVLIAFGVWGGALWATGYVSVASLLAAASFPVWVRFTAPDAAPAFWSSIALAVLIFVSHRANIARLIAGTENRFRTRGRAA
jgi:glycerol-3-phosphate acyltransferase PlsY